MSDPSVADPSVAAPGTAPVDLAEAYAAVRQRARQLWRRRILGGTATVLLLSGASVAAGVAWVRGIPTPVPVAVSETTTVYFSDGKTVMARLGEQNRTVVDLVDLPAHVPAAMVAAVDPGFWGGSGTNIARQYVRFTSDDDLTGITGQARVLVMANKLEDAYSKEQILELYLNAIYFGRRAYGIEAAAQTYFGKSAKGLDVAEAITLAGLIESPGNGRFDPTVNPVASQRRFNDIRDLLVSLGVIDGRTADELRVPPVAPDDPAATASGLERPTGLVVAHVLAELRQAEPFAGKPPGYLENGGFQIVTTVDAAAQSLLEQTADEAVAGSVMHGQTGNLQAAAVVIEPGTGRVLAYFGGHDGTGADYAGWHLDATGTPVGYGAHPPAQTFNVYTLAAALDAGMSVRSAWQAPTAKNFPGTGRDPGTSVRDFNRPPCQPTCTLAQAISASLNVPFFALAQTLRPAAVVDMARATGIDSMWSLPAAVAEPTNESDGQPRQRIDLGSPTADGAFGAGVGLGAYPITVLDHANGMATLAAEGVRAEAHFVRQVSQGSTVVYGEDLPGGGQRPVLEPAAVADLTWAMSQNPGCPLPGGQACALVTGEWPLEDSAVDTAHAWAVGFTPNLAIAVWLGNEEFELPLRDLTGARVGGSGLPSAMFARFMAGAHRALGLPEVGFPAPTFTGDDTAGDAITPALASARARP